MLKPGDPCPCCGQPIRTEDPDLLAMLTYIRDSKCNQDAFHKFLLHVAEAGIDAVIETEGGKCTPT